MEQKIIVFNGKRLVLSDFKRKDDTIHHQPNFLGLGMALQGVMYRKETLEQYNKRMAQIKKQAYENNR